jgi:outer membrane protein assembly factor BamB
VFVAGAGGEIAAVDAAGCGSPPCAPLWTGSVGGQITGSPAVSNGQVYVGTADGRLVAFGLPAA